MYRHVLVIGGTGMLRAASVAIASRSRILTSVARTRRSLAALNSLLPPASAAHHMLALDWNKPDQFHHSLQQHLAGTERPDLIVAWIHNYEVASRLAADLVATEPTARFFHVVGSATSDPSLIAATARGRLRQADVAYHQIVLGYVIADGSARWLTNEEISAGVLGAIARSEPEYLVGTLRPWSSRP